MKQAWILGPNPLDPQIARLPGVRPATLLLGYKKLITWPGTHATQLMEFQNRFAPLGQAPRGDEGLEILSENAVTLSYGNGFLEIPVHRNSPELVFQADKFLQERVPKYRIRFLSVSDPEFREKIRRRGELWRVTPRPAGEAAMREYNRASRTALRQGVIYYYNRFLGIRYLTYGDFAALEKLDDEALARQLAEIAEYLPLKNRKSGERELCLWPRETDELKRRFTAPPWDRLTGPELREACTRAREAFRELTDDALLHSEPEDEPWRTLMYHTLTREPQNRVELCQPGVLGPEFLYRIQWLPGARMENGECVLDPLFDRQDDEEAAALCDRSVRELILNQVREFTDIEFVNIGRIPEPLGPRARGEGRRDVFLMEIKRESRPRPNLRVIRFYKWGMREHLARGLPLDEAYYRALEYLEYSSNRRLGCRHLGLNLPARLSVHSIGETYQQPGNRYHGAHIWAFYAERDFIAGVPTHRLSAHRLQDPDYALRVADLMGGAAAANLVVARGIAHESGSGRADEWEVLFDQGDEVIRHDESGIPTELVTCDHSGSFALYHLDLATVAPQYARPVNRLRDQLAQPRAFADRYVTAFQERLEQLQKKYRERNTAFGRLFSNLVRDPQGNFAERWHRVLEKLAGAHPRHLARLIRDAINL
jgi:hypothetical protein